MTTLAAVIDTSHDDVIHDAAIDYYGNQLATCSSDNVVKIFHIKNGSYTHFADLKGHLGPVWQISWAHPKFGNILASCSNDRRIIVWKENREWTKMYECKKHVASVNSISFGPAEFGLILACGSSDGNISVHKLHFDRWIFTAIPNAHKVGVNAISWGPYISTNPIFMTNSKPPKRIASAGGDYLVKIWIEVDACLEVWEEVTRLSCHCDWVRDVSWSPSIAIPCSKIASASQDKKVIIWTSTDDIEWTPYQLPPFDDVVWSVNWSPTGNLLVVSDEKKVTLWKETSNGVWNLVRNNDPNYALIPRHKFVPKPVHPNLRIPVKVQFLEDVWVFNPYIPYHRR